MPTDGQQQQHNITLPHITSEEFVVAVSNVASELFDRKHAATQPQVIVSESAYQRRRDCIRDCIEVTHVIDGRNAEAVRAWTRDIMHANVKCENNEDVLRVMTQTVTGQIRDELEEFLTENAASGQAGARWNVPFRAALEHVREIALPPGETQRQRQMLLKMSRRSGESIIAFNGRFKRVMQQAYPCELTADHQEALVGAYLRAILDKDIAKAAYPNDITAIPNAISDIMAKAAKLDVKAHKFQTMMQSSTNLPLHTDEPMEVDAVGIRPQTGEKQLSAKIDKLCVAFEKMGSKVAKMEARIDMHAPGRMTRKERQKQQRFRKQGSWTEENQPICYTCSTPGHIAKNCTHPRKVPRFPGTAPQRREEAMVHAVSQQPWIQQNNPPTAAWCDPGVPPPLPIHGQYPQHYRQHLQPSQQPDGPGNDQSPQ